MLLMSVYDDYRIIIIMLIVKTVLAITYFVSATFLMEFLGK